MTRQVAVTLTVSDNVSNEQVHELVCLAVHEGHPSASVEDVGDVRNIPREPFVLPARQQGKTQAAARERVRKVAEGATINGTYRMLPGEALDAFRADLVRVLAG